MLNLNSHTARLNINPLFPRDELVNIMRPYLYLNYIVEMSMNADKRHKCSILLTRMLKQFYYFNRQFGRKTFNLRLKTHVYNSLHPDFKMSDIDSYSHDIRTAYDDDYSDWVQMVDDPIVGGAHSEDNESDSDSDDDGDSGSDSGGDMPYSNYRYDHVENWDFHFREPV